MTPTASSALTEGVLAKIRPVRPGEAGAEGVGRLLVVEDNETNRELISRQLARRGYTVATAPDGRQGLALLEQDGFDLILLDVIMPVLDGVETLRRIRSSERFRDTPVIMLSSLDETDSAVRCIEMGASDYVSKPIQPTLLESRIAAALEIRELRRRELAYRERVATDGELIERLLLGALPSALRDRVRAGDLEVEECWEGAAVVRCRLPAAVRSVVGHEAVARVRNIRGLLARFEEVARRHDVDAVLSRPDGFMAVLRPDGSPAEAVIGAARLVLDTIALWDGLPARFAIHVGDTVLGLVGEERPRLEVWGQAVDVVDGLSAGAGEGITLVTPAVQGFLKGRFACTSRGVVDVLGAGQMRVHALTGELEPVAAPDVGSPASS